LKRLRNPAICHSTAAAAASSTGFRRRRRRRWIGRVYSTRRYHTNEPLTTSGPAPHMMDGLAEALVNALPTSEKRSRQLRMLYDGHKFHCSFSGSFRRVRERKYDGIFYFISLSTEPVSSHRNTKCFFQKDILELETLILKKSW